MYNPASLFQDEASNPILHNNLSVDPWLWYGLVCLLNAGRWARAKLSCYR